MCYCNCKTVAHSRRGFNSDVWYIKRHQLSSGLNAYVLKWFLFLHANFHCGNTFCESCFQLLNGALRVRGLLRTTLCLWPLLMNRVCVHVAQASHIRENFSEDGGLGIGWPGRGRTGLNAAVFLPHSLPLILPLLRSFAKPCSFLI